MDHIFEHYKKTGYLHHAHLIEGGEGDIVPDLLSAMERSLGVATKGNPDLTILAYDSLGIGESRALTEMQSRAEFGQGVPGGFSGKIFIVTAKSFTNEAQNALLKTLEEPTPRTHFFIILPRLNSIRATLLSRVIKVAPRQRAHTDDSPALAEAFLGSSLEERFALAKKLTETKSGESIDREKIRVLLDHVERILYTRLAGQKDTQEIFRTIFQTKTYLIDRGSSPKMLLENLAIALPVH